MYVKSQKIDFLTYSIQEALNMAKELWVAKVFLAEKSRVLDLEYPFGHDCDDFFARNFTQIPRKMHKCFVAFGLEALEKKHSKMRGVRRYLLMIRICGLINTLSWVHSLKKSIFNGVHAYSIYNL